MSYLPQTKWGDCSIEGCGAKNVPCIKRGKNLICVPHARGNDRTKAIDKANKRDRDRADATKALRPKDKKSVRQSVASSIRSLAERPVNKETLSKSKLLKLCDAAFSRYVVNRDTSNGQILCPCCRKTFDVLQVDKDGKKVVQNLHFVSRLIYSLRFDEDNAHAGDSFCNLQMHLKPKGIEYQNYRQYLVNKLGEDNVSTMELEHRKINRLEEAQLKVILEHYSA